MKPLYQKISSLGFVTLFHAGLDHGFPPPYHGLPERFAGMLSWVESPVVLAHWGALSMPEETLKYLCGLPVWFDTSFGYDTLSRDQALRILDKHGIDKIVFASDLPWHRPKKELAYLQDLGLSADELETICYRNGAKLLGIK